MKQTIRGEINLKEHTVESNTDDTAFDENSILKATDVCYSYGEKNQQLAILDKLNITIKKGESVAIVGASGTGKSTLLHILGGLDKPHEGHISLAGKMFSSPKHQDAKQQGIQRNKHLGFVYQFHHLLAEFSALENVMMPLLIQKCAKNEAERRAQILLDQVGVGQRASHRPSELSGGERQRVAIARAMVTRPDCILADEPTGNLDQENATAIMSLLFDLQKQAKTALVIVTHDLGIASKMQKTYRLIDKKLLAHQ